jgi:hemerythrin-like domain-containing protein
MSHAAIRVLREEHQALSTMLSSFLVLLTQQRTPQAPAPDFAALRAILFYIDEFPERRHHRKESELLFPKLRARTPLARELIDRLESDHARGERRIRDLQHALLAYEMLGESRREAFEKAARKYVDFYFAHIATEESEILPLAERVLGARDWDELDEAFSRSEPAGGTEAEYQALFSRIACAVPAAFDLARRAA